MTTWFIHAKLPGRPLRAFGLIAAAHTALSARRQARKQLPASAIITDVDEVKYSHAWRIDFVPIKAEGL